MTPSAAAGAPVFSLPGEKPEAIAKKAYAHARDHGNDVVIIDTAGRLHVDAELMDELRRIKQEVPIDETLLVIDAMVGQDAVNVAKSFAEDIGIDGVILTKLDGDTRGGAALSVRAVTGKPIKFAGVGEKIDDLESFYPDRMAGRILGMGDVLTLIDKAQESFDEKAAVDLTRKMRTNSFTLEDYLEQIRQMGKMGSITDLLKMVPGLGSRIKDVDIDEEQVARAQKKNEAIILSMTRMERRNPDILNAGRKRRIAAGSGTTVQEINLLLKQFEQARQMMKQMMGGGKHRMRMPFNKFGG